MCYRCLLTPHQQTYMFIYLYLCFCLFLLTSLFFVSVSISIFVSVSVCVYYYIYLCFFLCGTFELICTISDCEAINYCEAVGQLLRSSSLLHNHFMQFFITWIPFPHLSTRIIYFSLSHFLFLFPPFRFCHILHH